MTAPISSFLMVVPPGWARLPAREEDRQVLAATVREVIARALPDSLPRDRAEPLRQEMQKRLMSTVVEAGDNGATAVYLPVQPVDGFTPPVSIIESEVDDESDQAPEEVIAELLADALPDRHDQQDPGLRQVDGGIAARTETQLRRAVPDEVAGELPAVDDRQVVYTIPVPHRPGRWVVMSFSAISAPRDQDPTGPGAETPDIGTDERITDALVMLFDAMMTTFRWTDVPDAEPTPLELRLAEIGGTA
ncbi:hypothetical protein [Curtobacterium sp. APC 4022]|uniref:hypothetical protein n=1 Tax=Curtobacterium sp. APC 4022 TaxID=3035201 RepID=UPI0025B3F55C|nr:hypothetical protein [Curtobacterium sp. APC 4022]MDN3478581.1 hypothetical protein [Curtobacterium sp. APC 4022]